VTSACGTEAGKLAYYATALITSESDVMCSVQPLTDDYNGEISISIIIIERLLFAIGCSDRDKYAITTKT